MTGQYVIVGVVLALCGVYIVRRVYRRLTQRRADCRETVHCEGCPLGAVCVQKKK